MRAGPSFCGLGEEAARARRDGYDFDLRDHGAPVHQGLVLAMTIGHGSTKARPARMP